MKKTILLLMLSLLNPLVNAVAQEAETSLPNERLVVAVSWFQHSAEAEALFYQAYNLARYRLDEALVRHDSGRKAAVVMDIDETILDNSPFMAGLVDDETDNLEGWYAWTRAAVAKALPGALDFVKYAQSRGVEVFYITNRDVNDHAPTLLNLKREGFPFADSAHLLVKNDLSHSSGNTSSKKGRREKVERTHEILLLIGDNLNDFHEWFEDRSQNNGKSSVQQHRDLFGSRFILMPNPMYGAWEKPVYRYRDGISEREKARLQREGLRVDGSQPSGR